MVTPSGCSGGSIRYPQQASGLILGVLVMRKTILAALLLTVAGCSSPPAPPGRSVGGPSAQQLAHGRWLRMTPAPIRLCDPRHFTETRVNAINAKLVAKDHGVAVEERT